MGYIFAFLSVFLAGTKDLFSKKLSSHVDGTLSTFASFAFALPFYFILLIFLTLTGSEKWSFSLLFFEYVLLRSLSDAGAEWCKMTAFTYGEISLVAPFFALSSLFLLILSPLITGDIPSVLGMIGVLIILSGTILNLTSKETSNNRSVKSIMYASLAAVFFALNSCFDRLAVKSASPALSGFTMTLFVALFFLPVIFKRQNSMKLLKKNSKNFTSRGFFEVSFMFCKLSALQYIQAPYLAGIMQLTIVYSVIAGKVVFNDHDFKRRLVAACLVVVGVGMIIVGK